jgi:hypothetical protein
MVLLVILIAPNLLAIFIPTGGGTFNKYDLPDHMRKEAFERDFHKWIKR